MFWSKLFSLFSNFLPFGVYVLVLSFVGDYNWILKGVLIGVVIIQIVASIVLYFIVQHEIKKHPLSTKKYKIVRMTKDRTSSLNFIVTNVFPLIALDLSNLGMIIFTAIVVLIIAILFFKNNLYLYNPILEISGYKIYNLEIEEINDKKETTNNVISKTFITNKLIPLNSDIMIREFEDDISF